MNTAILGLENSGKKTLFELLTGTVDHHIGTAILPDEKLDFIHKTYNSKKKTYIHFQFTLIPDITKKPDETRDSLLKAKECDILAIVIRNFKDENIFHPLESIDPKRDFNFISNEILFTDLFIIESRLEKIEHQLKSKKDEILLKEKELLLKVKKILEDGRFLSSIQFQEYEIKILNSFNLLSLKPAFIIINCDEEDLNKNFNLSENLKELNISVKIEKEILELKEEERKEYLNLLGLKEAVLPRIIHTAYEVSNLITFYTVNENEAKAWPVKKGTTAIKAAGMIHSDFEKGFIKAEVINFDDFKKAGSESNAKKEGLYRLEGKDYIIKDGDIIKFRFNK